MKQILLIAAIGLAAWYFFLREKPAAVSTGGGAGNEDYPADSEESGGVQSFWDGGNWGLPKFGDGL